MRFRGDIGEIYAGCTGDIDASHLRVRDQAAQMRQREPAAAHGVGLRLYALAPVRLPRRDDRDVIDHLVARRPRPIVHLRVRVRARLGDRVGIKVRVTVTVTVRARVRVSLGIRVRVRVTVTVRARVRARGSG